MAQESKEEALEAAQIVLLKSIAAYGGQAGHRSAVLNFATAYALLAGTAEPSTSGDLTVA